MAITINTLLAAALALQAAPPLVPLAPSGKWTVSYEPASCILLREFGAGKDKVTLAITPAVIGSGAELAIMLPDQGKPYLIENKGILRIGDKDTSHNFGTFVIAKAGVRITRTYLDDTDLDLVAGATTLTLPVTQDRSVSLSPGDMTKALAATETCRKDLQKSWGIDMAAQATIAEPAKGISLGDWITSQDYPAAALRAEQSGTVSILWSIGLDGRVHDCRTIRTSGSKLLDDAACEAITKRGRYTPAKTSTGRSVVSWGSRKVNWMLPKF